MKKRKGIGSQLLHELYNYLREERIETIQLMSIVSNQPFYEKNGMLRDNVGVMYAKVNP
ncbi:MAG: GNAT family N-acetyltransferase [Lachnospiraceae bacterium]|nr:GNAT family N-acetyltransferase [Lachnospiraceae bacterium]